MASSQLSTALSIILILTRDETLCKNLQNEELSTVEWYAEKSLVDISLGSLTVVVLLRAVQMSLHSSHGDGGSSVSSCLATLANLSPSLRSLHSYASQRLVNLFDSVGKRYMRLYEGHQQASLPSLRGRESKADEETKKALEEEMMYTEDLVRMVLEIFSLALSVGDIAENPHLTYSILHKKATFEPFLKEPFVSFPSLWEPLSRIHATLEFFDAKVAQGTSNSIQGGPARRHFDTQTVC